MAFHTCTHRSLVNLSSEDIERELRASKILLEEITGREVRGFAYPNYLFDERVKEIVKKYYDYARAGPNVPDRWNIEMFDRYQIGTVLKRDLPLILNKIRVQKIPVVMVFHDTSSLSLLLIIRYLKSFKAKFVSLAELVDNLQG